MQYRSVWSHPSNESVVPFVFSTSRLDFPAIGRPLLPLAQPLTRDYLPFRPAFRHSGTGILGRGSAKPKHNFITPHYITAHPLLPCRLPSTSEDCCRPRRCSGCPTTRRRIRPPQGGHRASHLRLREQSPQAACHP